MRLASCRCGDLLAECTEAPLRVSVCHCLECQRRTGSVLSAQARFAANSVTIKGVSSAFTRTGDAGSSLTYQFCPNCGSTIAYKIDAWPDVIAVPLGAFGDDSFPAPAYSIYERRKPNWLSVNGEGTEHID